MLNIFSFIYYFFLKRYQKGLDFYEKRLHVEIILTTFISLNLIAILKFADFVFFHLRITDFLNNFEKAYSNRLLPAIYLLSGYGIFNLYYNFKKDNIEKKIRDFRSYSNEMRKPFRNQSIFYVFSTLIMYVLCMMLKIK